MSGQVFNIALFNKSSILKSGFVKQSDVTDLLHPDFKIEDLLLASKP